MKMAIKTCQDIAYGDNVKAVYFDGTSKSINDLKLLLSNTNQLNMTTLHTKIGWWAIRYPDNSIVWRRNKCFENGYKIIK